jgi:hypothetical protein
MTTAKAKEQLALCIEHLHIEKDSFSIKTGHLVSKDQKIDFPVKRLTAIIPAHGTVIAIWKG